MEGGFVTLKKVIAKANQMESSLARSTILQQHFETSFFVTFPACQTVSQCNAQLLPYPSSPIWSYN